MSLKKLLSSTAAAVICMFAIPLNAGAAETGSAVYTAEELMDMEADGSYYLACDIDLSGVEWVSVKGFSGSFDGNGYEITGLTSENYGLFSTLKTGAVVENVKLTDVYITSKYKTVGAVASSIGSKEKNITVKNCFVSGVVASCRRKFHLSRGGTAGSIIGQNGSSSAVVSECYSNAVVAAEQVVGGIVGKNAGSIENCGFGGQIVSSYNILELCSNEGEEITDDYLYMKSVGGICGINYGKIDSCFNSCTYLDVAEYYGGIAGTLQKNGSITRSVNSYYVLNDDMTGGMIAGYAHSKAKVENCYSRKPTEVTVSNDIGKGKTNTVSYSVSPEKYGKISSFKRLGSGWMIADGVPVREELIDYAAESPLYEIKGGRLIPMGEAEDLSVDYGYDEFGDILE